MSEVPEKKFWKVRIEDPDGRDMTMNIDADLVAMTWPDERSYLLRECGEAVDHILSARERARKAEIEANPRPYRDVYGY